MALKRVFALALASGLLLGFDAATHATTVERFTLENLTSRCKAIVQGTVRGSRTYWSADRKLIFTSTTIEVSERIKGQTARTIEVTTLGGRIGETTLHVAGMPAFAEGENTIVFVEQSGAYLTVLGLGQGKFTVANGEVSNSIADLTFPDGRPARVMRMPVQTFKDEVRSIVERAH